MTGILRNSLPGLDGAAPEAALAAAASQGLDACLFNSLLDIAPNLDPARLRDARDAGRALGVRLTAGVPWIHPLRPDRDPALARLGDPATAVGRVLDAAADLGLTELFFMIGVLADRDDPALPWPDQLAATARFLTDLGPRLRDLGLRLLLKTHEEISSFEAARLVETVGPDLLGIAFDPVNLLVRLEEPTAAARRLAPYVAQIHLDDATLVFEGRTVRRHLALLGEGVLDWPAMLALLPPVPLLIDLHRGQFAVPALDPGFLRAQPDLTVTELAWIVGAAARGPAAPPPAQNASPERLSRALEFARQSGARA